MSNPARERLLADIAGGVIPVPIKLTAVGKLFSYPRLLALVNTDDFPAVKIGRRWYSTDSAVSAWVSQKNWAPNSRIASLATADDNGQEAQIEEVELPEERQDDESYL